MKKLEYVSSPLYSLSNVAFAQFFRELLANVKQIDPSKITDTDLIQLIATLTTLLEAYNKSIAKVTSSPITLEISELDSKRDWAYRRLSNMIKVECSSPVAENRQAALTIRAMVRPYGRVPLLSFEEETLAIDNIVAKLESAEYQPLVQLLNFAVLITDVKQANQEFKVKYGDRLNEQFANEFSDNKQYRQRLIEQYNMLCSYIQVMANLEKGEVYDEIFTIINTLRDTYTAQLNRMAPRKPNEPRGS